jgi:hypothetical protein
MSTPFETFTSEAITIYRRAHVSGGRNRRATKTRNRATPRGKVCIDGEGGSSIADLLTNSPVPAISLGSRVQTGHVAIPTVPVPPAPMLATAAPLPSDTTADGLRFAIFYTKVHDRLLRALFAADQPPAPPPIRKALHTINIHITETINQARLVPKAA